MGGVTSLLSIGSLNYDFGGSRTKTEKSLQKQALATGIWMFRDPDLIMVLGTFWSIFLKPNSENIIDLAPILRPLGGLDEDNLELTWCGVGLDRSSTVHSRM